MTDKQLAVLLKRYHAELRRAYNEAYNNLVGVVGTVVLSSEKDTEPHWAVQELAPLDEAIKGLELEINMLTSDLEGETNGR
jgi:hypothetical protein